MKLAVITILLATASCAPVRSAAPPAAKTAGDVSDTGAPPVSLATYADSALAAANTITSSFLMDRVNALADDAFAGRDNLSPGGLAARKWLAADLANLHLPPLAGSSYAQPFAAGANLCARIQGSDPLLRHEHVLIGAHYDHLGTIGAPNSQCQPTKGQPASDLICNGAVDNAAGVAVALAVVHALATSSHPPRRSVVLCLFDAEEDGLLGSRYFTTQAPLVPLSSVVAMLSVDNVGSVFLPGELSSFATDVEFSAALRAAVKVANTVTGMQTWPVSSFFVGQEGGGRSDHLPFREAGIPVLFIGSGSSTEYHTTADEPSVVHVAKLLQIARHTTVLVALIANADQRPDFIAHPAPHIDDAVALTSLADHVIAQPQALGLTDGQVDLVKGWRADLAAWIAQPPTSPAEWASYQALLKGILAAVYLFAG